MQRIEDLKAVMRKNGWTQEKTAFLLGVSFTTLNRWINGKFKPSIHIEEKLDKFIKENQ